MERQDVIWQLVDSSTIGGIESHVAALAECLAADGQQTRIVLFRNYGTNPWLTQLNARGLETHILNGGIVALIGAIRRGKPAILHTHGYKAGILGRIAGAITRTPVVSTFHAGERSAFPVNLYQFADEWTSFLSTRIAVSPAIAARMPYQTETIRNFVILSKTPHRNFERRSVAFVGRLSIEKGPDLFCEIALRADPSISFTIYGDGPMRMELERRFGSRVIFCGLQMDMRNVWPEIDLLLMPSRAEGLPMAALEAMGAGVPLAAARVGALPDLVTGGTGYLFEASDVSVAAQCIAEWSELPTDARRLMSEACRAAIEASYGPTRPIQRLTEIYGALRRR